MPEQTRSKREAKTEAPGLNPVPSRNNVEGLTPTPHFVLTAQRQPQRPISHYAAPPFASPEYEPWLDETLAIIRRVATLAQIEWHREQIAQLAGRLEAA